MKKTFLILQTVLMFSGAGAYADSYQCQGETPQETLQIHELENQRLDVNAGWSTEAGSIFFAGLIHHNENSPSDPLAIQSIAQYDIQDQKGEKAQLSLTFVSQYCGRAICLHKDPSINAKLTYQAQDHYFICDKK